MIPVSVLTGWVRSVVYVSALSLWALVSGHWAAWQAARVEVEQQELYEVIKASVQTEQHRQEVETMRRTGADALAGCTLDALGKRFDGGIVFEDDPDGNVQHIAEHGVTVDEAEAVLRDPRSGSGRSRRSGRPQVFGWTPTGKFLTVIWEEVSDDPRMIYPVTAYEVPPPKGG